MGFTFFILLLGALVFTLMQKHEAEEKRKFGKSLVHKAIRSGKHKRGRDNIYQFKIYCYNIRCLLELAQKDGIGIGEERNEDFYNKHRNEISKKYCYGLDPIHCCMRESESLLLKEEFACSWECLDHDKVNYVPTNEWMVYMSGYDLDPYKCIKNISLPKDGITNAEKILRALYYWNHSSKFSNVSEYKNDIKYYLDIEPGKQFDKSIPYFEESGITLYN